MRHELVRGSYTSQVLSISLPSDPPIMYIWPSTTQQPGAPRLEPMPRMVSHPLMRGSYLAAVPVPPPHVHRFNCIQYPRTSMQGEMYILNLYGFSDG